MNRIVNKLRQIQTPPVTLTDFEMFIHWMSDRTPQIVDLPTFLDNMCELHGWPGCFEATSSGFDEAHGIYWKVIADELARGNYIRTAPTFLAKYKKYITWSNSPKLYKYITEQWLLENEDIWPLINWTAIFTSVQLSERFLTPIMEQLIINNAQWNSQTPNIAFVASHQTLSEEFIERWYADTVYDKDHIWANIYRKQTLSDEFRAKHTHRKPKPIMHKLQQYAQAREQEERDRYERPSPSAAFLAKIAKMKN